MSFYTRMLDRLPAFQSLASHIDAGRLPAAVTGLSQVNRAHFAAALAERDQAPLLFLTGDEAEAARAAADLIAMGLRAASYPARDFVFRPVEGMSREYEHERLTVLCRLAAGELDAVVATVDAAMQYTIPPGTLAARTRTLKPGDTLALDDAAASLLAAGYTRAHQVEGVGQFSIRGGLIDFFPPGGGDPVRVELWGDQIDTIASFGLESQRRMETLASARIAPATEVLFASPALLAGRIEELAGSLRGRTAPRARERLMRDVDMLRDGRMPHTLDPYLPLMPDGSVSLFDHMPRSLLVVSDPVRVKERVRTASFRLHEDIEAALTEGVLCKGLTDFALDAPAVSALFFERRTLFFDSFARTAIETPVRTLISVDARQLSVFSGRLDLLLEDVEPLVREGWAVTVLAGTERAGRTLASDLGGAGLPAHFTEEPSAPAPGRVTVTAGGLSAGFEYPDAKMAVITHAGAAAGGRASSKRRHYKAPGDAIHSLSELSLGDYVVHTAHGIGVFEGIHKLAVHGITKDYIKIRYDKGDILYVPVTQLDLVSKYIGPQEDAHVRLHRLGGAEWKKSRSRVRAAVRDMAKELTALYAKRMQVKGYAFAPDGDWQRDFEERFAYEETDDQMRCVAEIKADMERDVPMDRLLCGDVGFGKTEVALRAAFKCVTDSKQCAILVPTTILAWQHYQTLQSRFDGLPVRVDLLSRFRSAKQQEETLGRLARGEVDIIVGTHRLISKDVKFRDLGLCIIDEEQRFGVAQKERLKALFAGVDCLTLTATPIPRTLNMSLSGIRDISVIEEAPQDRHPVQTYVLEYDEGVIADALRRELRRGGQAYYLHNRVESIERVAARLGERIPEARIGVAHGKMSEEELSRVWQRLIEHEIDILVCTTIIETGVDVPNCNTLVIEHADRMGLSQLHQIRGRVGRSARRAFAYLTFTRGQVLTEVASHRLEAIREFTEFGAGFKIAMRDLEIRGAGSLLGGEQHGHMESVGYEMYLRLLAEAMAAEKGEPSSTREAECLVDVQVEAHIPEDYIANLSQRLDIYRRIADIRTSEDASDVLDEIIDRFGDAPPAVEGLIQVALLRNSAADRGIYEVKEKNGALLFRMRTLDLEAGSKLAARMRGRVMLSAAPPPCLQVRMKEGGSSLDTMREVFAILNEGAETEA